MLGCDAGKLKNWNVGFGLLSDGMVECWHVRWKCVIPHYRDPCHEFRLWVRRVIVMIMVCCRATRWEQVKAFGVTSTLSINHCS